jgi:hypothetical protein
MTTHCQRHAICCLAIAILASGCGKSLPPVKTFPARGKVQFLGGKPFAGGIVTFTSQADPRLVMDAPIEDNGSFSLSMMAGDQRLDGAAEGAYHVMVSSRFAAGTGVQVYMLKNPVTIEPKENTLVIEVDPATARK